VSAGRHDPAALAELFSGLGRELATLRSVDQVLETISQRAYESIPAAQHAAISRGRKGNFETIGATSDLPLKVDAIQYELCSGPCVDAILADTTYRVGDLAHDQTWPQFGRRASEECGIHSMLSVRVYLEDDDLLAGLNLYSAELDAFDEADQSTAVLLATHCALAHSAARRQDKIDNLEQALVNSRRIGTAIGVLMASYRVTDEQAFDLLRIASQSRHRKLTAIAEDVIESGELELPPLPESRQRD
jgi:GAF domain-containing protein